MIMRRQLGKIDQLYQRYYWIFFYNEFTTKNTAIDTICEPIYFTVERIAKSAGHIFVGLVTVLTSSVVLVYYTYIFPHNYYRQSLLASVIEFIMSLWLLINIVFHYYMGVNTKPGSPPPQVNNAISVCRNCISPKPPRTHHCSVCGQCILRMDHHCPWLNNCVGHYNHRYFLSFCAFMFSGTVFVSITAFNQFVTYWPESRIGAVCNSLFGFNAASVTLEVANDTVNMKSEAIQREQFWVMYEFILCFWVAVTLSILTSWHAYLITKGETSVEKHINQKETQRLAQLGIVYRNPYDFGVLENWYIFFGIEAGTGRSWRHVIFPSTHNPTGNGAIWRTSF